MWLLQGPYMHPLLCVSSLIDDRCAQPDGYGANVVVTRVLHGSSPSRQLRGRLAHPDSRATQTPRE